MNSLHHRIRGRINFCARQTAGVIAIVVVLATSSLAQTPGYGQRRYPQSNQSQVFGQASEQPGQTAQPPNPQEPVPPTIDKTPPPVSSLPPRRPTVDRPPPSQPTVDGPPPGQGQTGPVVPTDGRMRYRGFKIDATQILDSPRYAAIMASMPRQIDIVMASGVRPEVLRFFQSETIVLRYGLRGQSGHFDPHVPGVSIEDTVADPERPIVLHELLHAYHWYVIPGGFRNPDILTFYRRAVDNRIYRDGAYVSKNVQEYFAVTASLYLWGHVARPPFTRENLRARQPFYYQWLARFFDVQK